MAFRRWLVGRPYCYVIHKKNGERTPRITCHRLLEDLSIRREYVANNDPEFVHVMTCPKDLSLNSENYQINTVSHTLLLGYAKVGDAVYSLDGVSDVWCCYRPIPHAYSSTEDAVTDLYAIERRIMCKTIENAQIVLTKVLPCGDTAIQRGKLGHGIANMKRCEHNFDAPTNPFDVLNVDVPNVRVQKYEDVLRLGQRFAFARRIAPNMRCATKRARFSCEPLHDHTIFWDPTDVLSGEPSFSWHGNANPEGVHDVQGINTTLKQLLS